MKNSNWLLITMLLLVGTTFTYAQNVGIGTDAPQRKLHIHSNTVFTGLMLSNEASGATANDGFHLGIQYQADAPGNRYGFFMLREDIPMFIGTNNLERMRIAANGNVGIGASSPSEARLQVHEPAGNTQFIAAAGNNLPGVSAFVPISSPSIGYNIRYQNGYKFMGSGYGSFWQFSPSLGRLQYYYSSTTGAADGSVSSVFALAIDSSGRLGIGVTAPTAPLHVTGNVVFGSSAISPATGYKLSVDGKIICEELKVQLNTAWPDYVFENNYVMPSLKDLEEKVMTEKHLPGIPSALEVESGKGVEIGAVQQKLLEKVEELYRYVFEMNKENQQLRKDLDLLRKQVSEAVTH